MEATLGVHSDKTRFQASLGTPLAASNRPAKARSTPAPTGSPTHRESPSQRHLTGKPVVDATSILPLEQGLSRSTDRESAVAVLDTTAQPCQSPETPTKTPLQNRARRKYLTNALVQGLTGLGETTPLRFAYASTARCAAELVQEGVTVRGKYCRQRWCLVCSGIRTAKLIRAYLPEMLTWPDPQFVTLTIPNVQGSELHGMVRLMIKTLPRLARGIRRTDGLEVKAVRKLEVTYNLRRRDYHPHLHLIVNTRAVADALVRRWMKAFPAADAKAQDIRPANGTNAMKELFKYFTKLTVKGLDGERTAPHPRVLDTMFKAVKGLRTFQSMGFVSHVQVDEADETLELDAHTVSPIAPDSRGLIRWQWIGDDWMDYSTGELLSDYTPSDVMRELVTRIVADARAAPI